MRLLPRLAWRNVWRPRRRSWLTAVAIGVAVALCFGTVSLQAGMVADMFDTLVRRQIGHAQIHAPGFPGRRAIFETIPDAGDTLAAITELEEVEAAASRVHGFALLGGGRRMRPGCRSSASIESVHETLGERPLLVRPWHEVHPTLAQIVALQDTGVWVVLLIAFGVASLGVLNTMLMSVLERMRELGVLIALGLRPGRVLALILLETSILAGAGLLVGGTLGALLVAYLMVYGLDLGGGAEIQYAGVAFDPVIHGEITARGVVATLLVAFVVAVLAALWPAARAARLEPVAAMRAQ